MAVPIVAVVATVVQKEAEVAVAEVLVNTHLHTMYHSSEQTSKLQSCGTLNRLGKVGVGEGGGKEECGQVPAINALINLLLIIIIIITTTTTTTIIIVAVVVTVVVVTTTVVVVVTTTTVTTTTTTSIIIIVFFFIIIIFAIVVVVTVLFVT